MKDSFGESANFFPVVGDLQIDGPAGVRGISLPFLQTLSHGVRLGVTEQHRSRRAPPNSCLQEGLADLHRLDRVRVGGRVREGLD